MTAFTTAVLFSLHRKDSGSFELNVNGLSIAATTAIKSDSTGRPDVTNAGCTASVGSARIRFRGGAR